MADLAGQGGVCERHGSAFAEIDQKLTHYSLSLKCQGQ